MALTPLVKVVYPNITSGSTSLNINGAFGWNLITLYDDNQTGVKMVLQLYKGTGYTNKIAELRQYPNLSGYCHFDVRHILQNNLSYTENLETISETVRNTAEELIIQLKVGYENTTGAAVVTPWQMTTTSQIRVIPARKNFKDLTFDFTKFLCVAADYTGTTGTFGGYVNNMNPLTDRVHKHIIKNKEDFTISLSPNILVQNSFGAPTLSPALYKIYTGYYWVLYRTSGGNVVTSFTYDFDDTLIQTYQLGYSNPLIKPYFDDGTLYRVELRVAVNPGFPYFGITTEISHTYDVDLEDDCRDYEPVQVSWINSYGFRDYFTFQKRWEKSISVTKNTYKKLLGNWAGGLMTIPSYDRGDKVFSQNAFDNITLTTKYLEDNEAEFLKNLYLSPDVKIKFRNETEWVPVILQDQNWTQRTFRKDKYFQYTINLKYANDINTQK